MARTDPQLNVRLPSDLLELLKAAAASSGRTLAAELIERLQWSFPETVDALLLSRRLAERDLLESLMHESLRRGMEAEERGDFAIAEVYRREANRIVKYHARIDEVAKNLAAGAGMLTSIEPETESPRGEVVQFPKRS